MVLFFIGTAGIKKSPPERCGIFQYTSGLLNIPTKTGFLWASFSVLKGKKQVIMTSQEINRIEENWNTDPRWQGIKRLYTAADVWRLRGSTSRATSPRAAGS